MRHMYKLKPVHQAGILALAVVASGCQMAGQGAYTGYPNPYPPYNYSYGAPPGSPQALPVQAAAPATSGFDVAAYQDLKASNQNLKDRLDRVEKAMLRLDRRMQLVERNELSRMGADQTAQLSPGTDQQVAMRSLGMVPAAADDGGQPSYRPVSSHGEPLTTVLQVTPAGSPPVEPLQVASRAVVGNGLPSLADAEPASYGRTLQPGTAEVAIWTVQYEADKVWPNRDQLPASREVVESLRQADGVTITARGKNSNSVEFRQRVKALSRYLSKVSSLDSVPIAAMAAPHMDADTIEIIATH